MDNINENNLEDTAPTGAESFEESDQGLGSETANENIEDVSETVKIDKVVSEVPKSPFAEGPVSATDISKSLLNNATQKREREKIEKEIASRRKSAGSQTTSSSLSHSIFNTKNAITLVTILIALFATNVLIIQPDSIGRRLFTRISWAVRGANVKIVSTRRVVLGESFRLTMTTNGAVDVAVMLVSAEGRDTTRHEGEIIAISGDGNKTWVFESTGLRRGSYTYKCFAKNSITDEYKFELGTVDID